MMMTMKRIGRAALMASVLGGVMVGTLSAQVFTPSYLAPRSSSDLGVYLSDGPGDFAVEGIWRRASGGYDLGFRAGLADTPDLSVLVGAEIRNPLSVGAPVDLAVTGTAQGVFGDVSGGGFLAGLSLGGTFGDASLSFTPYIHPQVGVVQPLFNDEFDLELRGDIGLDIRVTPSLDLRFAFGLDSRASDWGIGIAWR